LIGYIQPTKDIKTEENQRLNRKFQKRIKFEFILREHDVVKVPNNLVRVYSIKYPINHTKNSLEIKIV